MKDTFGCRGVFEVDGRKYQIARLAALEKRGWNVSRLPYSLRILLENLLRNEDGELVTAEQIEALATWQAKATPSHVVGSSDAACGRPLPRYDAKATPAQEINFTPARVLMQDFTGVPAVVDLAAMRDAMVWMGGDPKKINPLFPTELVIDHSVQVDEFGTPGAFRVNAELEFERNRERYAFLRWGQKAFSDFKVVPPDTGIVHQVNLEYLARVVMTNPFPARRDLGDSTPPAPLPRGERGASPSAGELPWAYPDTVVGTDSHTTMINGLGVLGWGVGGIEAEAAMLGQPMSMLIPQVVGFRITGALPEGSTATDLVLTVTQILRKKGVVGKFVEFFGPGLASLPLADRATIANMAPEYGATCGIFPVDAIALDYLKLTGRPPEQVRLVEAYMKEQGLFHTPGSPEAEYSDVIELDLATVEPSLAGPKRPQDRVRLSDVKRSFHEGLSAMVQHAPAPKPPLPVLGRWEGEGGDPHNALAVAEPESEVAGVRTRLGGEQFTLGHGSVVIAAITSCTNTSNPSVMLAAGLVAKKAVERGLEAKPWVKTSLAPGSKVVTDYLQESGLTPYLERLKFHLVGYGCTTCIGNSGPLPPPISQAIHDGNLVAAAVLSGNRNFEGRINPDVRANYLASPPLVVAYALAGTVDIDLANEPLGTGKTGEPVYLRDIWPSQREVAELIRRTVRSEMFRRNYAEAFAGDERWQSLPVPEGDTYAWDPASTYVKHPPYFVEMPPEPPPVADIAGARVLAVLGDSITTDHISPAGSIKKDSPAGQYLIEHGVEPKDFNSYGARRGNHELMMRGTFANVRLKNRLVPDVEGGFTVLLPGDEKLTIYDAAMKYQQQGVPLVVLAGKEYGSGSSRDWAAKGPRLLGVRAVIAESFERIHRSNLVGMGVLPLEFKPGENVETLGLTGREVFEIVGLAACVDSSFQHGRDVTVRARRDDGSRIEFAATVRIDTPQEVQYYRHGGILHFVLRQLLAN